MQLLVVLTDHEGFEHNEVNLVLDEQAPVFSLRNKVSLLWNIDPCQQTWFLKGGRPISVTDSYSLLSENGLSHMDKLFVKHAEVERWSEYTAYVEKVLKQDENKHANAILALKEYERLANSDFFVVYSKFRSIHFETLSEISYWADEDIDSLREATKQYFLRLHNEKRKNEDSELICYFQKREELEGSRTNTLAFVRIHGETSITKYNVKYHHNSSKRSRCCQLPDITELYCYKLLDLIGVCPKCHIIPSIACAGTVTDAYIATRWDDNFERCSDFTDENNLVFVQMLVLAVLLYIDNLQERNCGRWKGTENAAAIVDFAPTGDYLVYSDIEKRLMTSLDWGSQHLDVGNRPDNNSWLTIVKKYVDKWDLVIKIELARQQFDPNNVLLERLETDYEKHHPGWSPTEQLAEYIETLYRNVGNLHDTLSYIV